jgi:biopolymer transport protein ExbD
MSLKKTTRRGHGTLNELNITPLLDLVFVLLVIFIITTPQLVNNLEMFLPSGKPPPADPNAPKPNIYRIVVDAQGQIFLNDQAVTSTQLWETLKEKKQAEPGLGVVVKGSDDADYQHIVNVLDVLQQLEITKVGLATDAPNP